MIRDGIAGLVKPIEAGCIKDGKWRLAYAAPPCSNGCHLARTIEKHRCY